MKSVKVVIGCCVVVLVMIAIYLKITSSQAHGGFVRGAQWHDNTLSSTGVLFCAGVLLALYVLMVAVDREKR